MGNYETKYERNRDLEVLALGLSQMTEEERFRVMIPEPFESFSMAEDKRTGGIVVKKENLRNFKKTYKQWSGKRE